MRKISLIVAALLVVCAAVCAWGFSSSRPIQFSDGSTAGEDVVVYWTDEDGDVKYPAGVDIYSRGTSSIRVRTPSDGGDKRPFVLLPGDSYVYAGRVDTVLVASQTDTVEVRGLLR